MKKLLDFDLEIALKEPERAVFSDGTKVEDWHYFRGANSEYPIAVQGKSRIEYYTIKGEFLRNQIGEYNLKLLLKTKTWYFCVYKREGGTPITSVAFDSKDTMQLVLGGDKDVTILQEYTYTEELP